MAELSGLIRVVRNTLVQLMRLFFGGVFTLISTRFALAALGRTDYGIYTVCVGIGLFFGFLTGAITIVTQRTLSMSIHDESAVNAAFKCCLKNHLRAALFFMIAGLGVAFPFLAYGLDIPSERAPAAAVVVLGALTAGGFGILAAPFEAYLWAKEEFAPFGVLNVLGAGLVAAGSSLLHFYSGDKLIGYAAVTFGSNIFVTTLGVLFVVRSYRSASINMTDIIRAEPAPIDSRLFTWNVIGSLSMVLMQQGIVFIVYSFHGAAAAAAMGIASQVANLFRQFGQALNGSLSPGLYALEIKGERSAMVTNALVGSKYVFMMVSIPAMIFCDNSDFILSVWLGSSPMFTGVLSKFLLISLMVEALTSLTFTVWQAIGSIRKLYLYNVSIAVAVITILYVSSLAGLGVAWLGGILIFAAFANTLIRIVLLGAYQSNIVINWISTTAAPCLLSIAPVFCWLAISVALFDGWLRLVVGGCGALVVALPAAYFVGLGAAERLQLFAFSARIFSLAQIAGLRS